jgi:NADH:ubiquinone oxidoreductase subunit 3 (subunit A)
MEALGKLIVAVGFIVFVVAISLIGMMWGWGLEAKNWGWVAFSYVGIFIAPIITALKD